ncbi:Dimer-Tnp-hAT domain containing protein [Pyrenophora tritici-repentis]|nr:Dimer-Tnp-hAT domain containing protein [Pyrenophora tritici-repentis]
MSSKDENEDLRMVRSIEMGWFVLEKYYNMTDQVPVYASAILLNPASRAAYLKKNWPAEWYEPAINAAQNFWVNEFKDALPLASPTASQQMAPPLKQRGAVLDQILQQMSVAAADQSNSDDLKIFAESPVIQIDCSPLEWWCRSEQRQRYPRLSNMAISILSIAAESSEPERHSQVQEEPVHGIGRGSLAPTLRRSSALAVGLGKAT